MWSNWNMHMAQPLRRFVWQFLIKLNIKFHIQECGTETLSSSQEKQVQISSHFTRRPLTKGNGKVH